MLVFTTLFLSALTIEQTENLKPFFDSPEHVVIGDEIELNGLKSKTLKLSNGLELSFGDLVSMPDFYGIVSEPIARGKTAAEQKKRFLKGFASLAKSQEALEEASKILAVIHAQRDRFAQKLPPLKSNDEQHMEYNCLTGGACSGSLWWLSPGRYLDLAKQDYDHFGINALIAYKAGHTAALEAAVQGNLELAYALDAFAAHFLTDRFAAGHLRVPRTELPDHVTPSAVGSLLGGYMHAEENQNGLHVHNKRGDSWIAFGDHRFFDTENAQNRAIMREALVASTNEIYQAFLARQMPIKYQALELVPEPDENASNPKYDVTPLFHWNPTSKTIMRRSDTKDVHSKDYTSTWWGWSTLAQLRIERGSI